MTFVLGRYTACGHNPHRPFGMVSDYFATEITEITEITEKKGYYTTRGIGWDFLTTLPQRNGKKCQANDVKRISLCPLWLKNHLKKSSTCSRLKYTTAFVEQGKSVSCGRVWY